MIPKKVKIGWRTYKVEIVTDIDSGDGKECFAAIDYMRTKIYITESLAYEEQMAALFHEIMHGVFYQAGHKDLKENEDAVECVASGLMGLIKDNPKLFIKEKGEII